MSLCYYIPGRQGATLDVLRDLGLGHAFEEATPKGRLAGRGPDDGEGLFIAPTDGRGLSRARTDLAWQKAPGQTWWIGTNGSGDPKALARDEQIDGHLVKLGDGNEWLVPVARSFARGSVLPESLVLGDDGVSWVGEPLERFVAISAKAESVELAFRGDLPEDAVPLDMLQEGAQIVTEALALNYRVSALEVSALRLLTGPIIARALWAFIDGPTLESVAKEMEATRGKDPAGIPGGSSSFDGAEG
jgi:hypothetical protein